MNLRNLGTILSGAEVQDSLAADERRAAKVAASRNRWVEHPPSLLERRGRYYVDVLTPIWR